MQRPLRHVSNVPTGDIPKERGRPLRGPYSFQKKVSALASKKAKHLPIAAVEDVNEDAQRHYGFGTKYRLQVTLLVSDL
jgi:hypothetical protein